MDRRDELQEHFRRMRAELLMLLDGLNDDQMIERTLDGWSVKDHLTHVAFWDELRAAEIDRISAGFSTCADVTDNQAETLNQINHALFADCTLDQAMWEIGRAHQRVLDAIAVASERGLEPEHYADVGLESDHEAEHIGWIRQWRERMGY